MAEGGPVLGAYRLDLRVAGQPLSVVSEPAVVMVREKVCPPGASVYVYDPVLRAVVSLPGVREAGWFRGRCYRLDRLFVIRDAGAVFGDVPTSHWASPYIRALARRRVVRGYGLRRFEPEREVSRGEWAKLLVLAAGLPGSAGSVDAESAAHWARPFVATVLARGIMRGYGDGGFRPGRPVSRAEAAASVMRALGEAGGGTAAFSDVRGHWAEGFIAAAAARGIMKGFPDGTFRPEQAVTRAQACQIAALAFRREEFGFTA